MITEAIDFRFLLLENYKKMKITENELAVLFMIDHLSSQGNGFVDSDRLSLKMTMPANEIEKTMAELYSRGFIDYVLKPMGTVISLDPLKQKLFREFQMTSSFEEATKNDKKVNDMINNVYGEFEKLLGRPLSQVEFSRIREWIAFGYSDEMIINALKEALSKGKKSLRSVDKILMNWEARNDIEKDGMTTLGEDWDKNLEETIRIAKTPWIDSDDED